MLKTCIWNEGAGHKAEQQGLQLCTVQDVYHRAFFNINEPLADPREERTDAKLLQDLSGQKQGKCIGECWPESCKEWLEFLAQEQDACGRWAPWQASADGCAPPVCVWDISH